jgi:hypothetical protein
MKISQEIRDVAEAEKEWQPNQSLLNKERNLFKLLTCKVYKTLRFNTITNYTSSKRSCSKFRTMIIISSPTPQVGEIETIHSLLRMD